MRTAGTSSQAVDSPAVNFSSRLRADIAPDDSRVRALTLGFSAKDIYSSIIAEYQGNQTVMDRALSAVGNDDEMTSPATKAALAVIAVTLQIRVTTQMYAGHPERTSSRVSLSRSKLRIVCLCECHRKMSQSHT